MSLPMPDISVQLAPDEQLNDETDSCDGSSLPNRNSPINDVPIEEGSSGIGTPSEGDEFLDMLYSYTLNQVSLEPSRLSGLKNELLQQQEEIILANYPSLITTSDQLNDISSEVSKLSKCGEL